MPRRDIGEDARTMISQGHSCLAASISQSWLFDSKSWSSWTGADA